MKFVEKCNKDKVMDQRYFVVYHKDSEVCQKSSSGGAFTAITDEWFSAYGNDAVIYGCVLDSRMKARHQRATTLEQRDAMRGSKYIGSDMSGIMHQVAEDLKKGKYVCFSGTPCQIAGLKSFLKIQQIHGGEHLLTVEVICHGVGSNRFFEDYLSYYERKYKSKVISCNFRGKMRPGKHQQMVICFENGKRYESPTIRYDGFYSAYLKNYIMRPVCYSCKYAKQERCADISLADNWTQEKNYEKFGSLIITNSELGCYWMDICLLSVESKEITKDMVYQPHMNAPCSKPLDYEKFWIVYDEGGYSAAQMYLGNITIKVKIKRIMMHLAYHLRVRELVQIMKRWFKMKPRLKE